jgi:ATP-dependent exoDNAse (exonuclease V) beta subunit
MGSPIQLLILGDPRQCLYEFKGADTRFLTMADIVWTDFELLSSKEFVHCSLKMSYRITNQMSKFVNDVMLGHQLMSACRDGEPVTYIRNNRKNIEKTIIYTINELLTNGGVKPNEIFVLAASVKGLNSHVRKMENALVEQNIPCHVPMFDTEKLDDRIIEGKIVFSTFHCAKGRQRKYVFLVGFDNNYFEQFARTSTDTTECPNTLYVGCTRATHGLYLLEFDQRTTDRPLDFLKMGHHEMKKQDYIKFNGMPRSLFYVDESEASRKSIIDKKFETPTKLIKFIPDYILDIITPIIENIFVAGSPMEEITIHSVINTRKGFFEAVSDLNGIAIPCMFYDSFSKENPSNVLYNMVENSLLEMKEHEHEYLKKIVKELPTTCETIDDYLFLANVNNSIQERLYFKVKQIERDEYTWLSTEVVNQCMERLNLIVGGEPGAKTSEFTLIHHSMEDAHAKIDQLLAPHFPESYRFRFSAILDLVTDTSVWELKCTENINLDHKLQLIIYAWLWKMMDKPTKEFKLFNITTGELYTLNSGLDEELNTIVIALLRGKYDEQIVKTDDEFIEMCREYLLSTH